MMLIANSAAEFLTGLGHPVAVSHIVSFLQNNSDFVAMCEYLESLGSQFDRGEMARHLLEVVERCKSAQSAHPTSSTPLSTSVGGSSTTATVDPTDPAPLRGRPLETPGKILGKVVDRPQPSPSHPPAGMLRYPIEFLQTSLQNPLVIEDSPSPPPAFEGSGLPKDRHEGSFPRVTAQASIALVERVSTLKAARVIHYKPDEIAKHILIVVGRHPGERPLNAHLLCLKENLDISPQSDLETIRWDLIDPEPVVQDVNMDAIPSAETGLIQEKRKRTRKSTKGSQGSRVILTASAETLLGTASAETPTTIEAPLSAPATTSQHTLDGSMLAGGPTLARSQPANTAMEPGHPAKKRRTAAYQPTLAPGGPSRPAFKKYKCKWKDCSAELHNYDNLRRHVFKAHKKKNLTLDSFPCQWEGCRRPPTERQLEGVKGRKDKLPQMIWDFQQEEDWTKHAQEHLEIVKNSLGVGPAALPSGIASQTRLSRGFANKIIITDQESAGLTDVNYLSDQYGNIITPIAGPAQPGHKFTPPPGFKATRQFNIAHGIDHHVKRRNTMGYRTALERARIMGAGMEGNPAAELIEHDDGSWKEEIIFRTISADWPPKLGYPLH
jgi:hypothetical protein